MTRRFKILIKYTGLYLCLSIAPINAQILQDTTSLNLIRENIGYIYNMQFDKARDVQSKIRELYPDHPVLSLLNGMITYWENYPLVSSNYARNSFENEMRQCIKLCENRKDTIYEAEYLLTNLCARAMLLMFFADNDLSFDIISLMPNTYGLIRQAFDFVSDNVDLNFFTGLYNYYREAYPKAYPVYQPIAFLFPGGNIEIGLKQLQTAAINSVLLRAESYFLLAYIYLNFENNYPEAIFYSKSLNELYPGNILYQALYIKNLLLMRQYEEAEKLIIASPDKTNNRYFQAQLTIFKGILQEKKYFNNKLAQEYYEKGISDISNFDGFGNEYAAYAFYGLSRISVANGDNHRGKIYRKEAIKLADFKKINFDK